MTPSEPSGPVLSTSPWKTFSLKTAGSDDCPLTMEADPLTVFTLPTDPSEAAARVAQVTRAAAMMLLRYLMGLSFDGADDKPDGGSEAGSVPGSRKRPVCG
jgi:hypothetical protein